MESLFNKVQAFRPATSLKRSCRTPVHVYPREYCETFKSTYFVEHLRTDASVVQKCIYNTAKFFMMELFAKMINDEKLLAFFTKTSIIDV